MMRKLTLAVALVLLLAALALPVFGETDNYEACWGQATAAFAEMGEMGLHASQQPTPRAGLGNLAQALFDDGIIEDNTLQALAVWLVSIDPDLTVEACMVE